MTMLNLGTGLLSSPPQGPGNGGGAGGPATNSAPVIPNITLQFDVIRS